MEKEVFLLNFTDLCDFFKILTNRSIWLDRNKLFYLKFSTTCKRFKSSFGFQ